MNRIFIILNKQRKWPKAALGLNTIIFKHVYWCMQQISGERLQDHWSSGSHIASTGGGNEYLCFLFRSDKYSGCYGNLKFPLTCMEKKWKLAFSVVRLGIFDFCFYINVY